VNGRDAFVLSLHPKAGAVIREYIDAETYLPIRMVATIEVPQTGADVEQTTDLSEYRDVDGIKIPFHIRSSSSAQTLTIALTTVRHNVPVDEALFEKPPTP
jgi:hypothetical protein